MMVELDSIEKNDGNISLLFSVEMQDWKWLEKEIINAELPMNVNKKDKIVKTVINGNTELLFWIR